LGKRKIYIYIYIYIYVAGKVAGDGRNRLLEILAAMANGGRRLVAEEAGCGCWWQCMI